MQIFDKPDNLIPDRERAVGLGFFDGVHRGHLELLRTLVFASKAAGLLPAVFTFPSHPETILHPEDPFDDYLSDLPARIEQIAGCGVEEIHLQPFDSGFAVIEPEAFLEDILERKLKARLIVVGDDYRFGRGGRGNTALLEKWAKKRGVRIMIVPQVHLGGDKISSSRIRKRIVEGELAEAENLLGRPYRLTGQVVTGRRLGHSLGFPTANIPVPSYLSCPAFGVYATRTTVDGRTYLSVTNIGLRPTVEKSNSQPVIETHLFDVSLDLYGKEIAIDFLARIRPEIRFSSVEAMGERIRQDLVDVRTWHDNQEKGYEMARINGLTLQVLPTRRFAQASLHLVFYLPLEARSAAQQALLIRVLTASCRRYPSRPALASALARLYGSSIEAGVEKEGDLQEISLTAEGIARWTDGSSPFGESCALLFDLLFDPLLDEDGLFDAGVVEAERQNLLLELAARENDRAKYAYDRCLAAFCGPRVQGLPPAGGSEFLQAVTRQDLARAYERLLTGARIDLYLGGQPDPSVLETCLEGMRRFPVSTRPDIRPALLPSPFEPEPPASLTEYKAVEQARIVMAYYGLPPYFSQQSVYTAVMNSMLGGDVHSLLFDVVREKLGLAYSVYSMGQRCLSSLFVIAGVAPGQVEAAQAAIDRQVANLAAGRFDRQLFDRSCQMIEAALLSAGDDLSAMMTRLIKSRLYGRTLNVDMLRAVRVEDIIHLAGQLKLVTSYVLTAQGQPASSALPDAAAAQLADPAPVTDSGAEASAGMAGAAEPDGKSSAEQIRTASQQSVPDAFSFQETTDTLTGKQLRTYRHASGLVVKILPRPGFARRFAAVTVPFGSIYTSFSDGRRTIHVPAGTAHFLEHCVFSRDDDGGLMGRLSSLGASANAYTTHSHTLYYFSTVNHFSEALDLYLDAVFDPYLGSDRVEAERPIILAELDQYRDDPDTRAYMKLVENLYAHHPVREDIGGTADSVRRIRPRHLELVWRHFYQPASLTLTLAGDIDEVTVLERLSRRLARRRGSGRLPGELVLPAEPATPASPADTLKMDVTAPSFLIGFKDSAFSPARRIGGLDLVFRQKAGRLLLETLLSPSSPLYDTFFAAGLINDSFGSHYACEDSFAFLVCGGESNRPDEAVQTVREQLVKAFRSGLDEELFEIQKRAAAGDFVRSLDSIDHSGMIQAQCNLYGIDLFDYPALYDKMDVATVSRMMAFLGDPASCSVVILLPGGEENHDT